jgi:four helix bundle protein
MVAGYRDLKAWQFAVELADEVYSLTERWPSREHFALSSQARRAAISIPANIAEGQGRLGKQEFRQHLAIAYGSLCELETLIHLGTRRGFCTAEQEQALLARSDETGRIIRGLMRSLETD